MATIAVTRYLYSSPNVSHYDFMKVTPLLPILAAALAAQDANPLSADVKHAYLRMKGLVPPSTEGQ